jgi:Carboxypeptidase regulatory-like domain/TonB-dependent Receptor Plug Domain
MGLDPRRAKVGWRRSGRGRSLAPLAGLLAGLLGLIGLPAPRAARADGPQTGLIVGQVVDASGAGVAAVQVTVAGPQIRRTELADDQGRFRFPALGVGTYDVHGELLGLAAEQRGVQVSIGRTTLVQLRLVGPGARPATGAGGAGTAGPETGAPPTGLAAQESIQVVAEASVIDRFDTRIGATVGFDFIDRLPVQRFYQSVALLLPGVTGGEDGNPNVNGALRSDNQFLIDGVDTTDPATGLFGLNLAYQAIQEVSVTTAAAPAEYGRSSGGVINVVTRSGSNEYQGVARLLATNNSWNDPYDYPGRQVAPLAPEIAAANSGPFHIDPTVALSLGGPLLRDRLYLFGAYDDSQSTFMGPTHQGTLWDRGSEIESSAAKVTWQVSPENTVVGQFTNDSTDFAAFDPFDRGFAENRAGRAVGALQSSLVDRIPGDIFALERQTQDGNFEKLQWNSALRQDMSAELTLAQQRRELTRRPLNSRGLTADAPHLAVIEPVPPPPGEPPAPQLRDLVLYNGITDDGFERRPRRQGNLVINGFVQLGPTDHELKTGVDFQRTLSERHFNFPGMPGTDPATGNPVEGQLFTDLGQAAGCGGSSCPPFDPATGRFQPFQLDQFWRRGTSRTVEQTFAVYLSDAIAVERWLVSLGGRFESIRATDRDLGKLIDSGTLAPRVAVTFDASGDRKVLLVGTYGWYYEPFLHSYLDTFSNFQTLSGYTPYTWNAGDRGCAGKDPRNLDSRCWVAGVPVPFAREQPAFPNDDLRRSWVDEATVGFERQLTASVGVSLYYIHRRWHDLWDNVIEGIFSPGGRLLGTTSQVVNLPQARRQLQSLQLLVQKRYSDHWQLLGSYARSRTEGNLFDDSGTGTSSFADFRDVSDVNLVNRFGLAPYDRRDQLKVFSNYRWAWRGVDLSLGSAALYESGLPYQMEVLDPLGVRFLTPRGSLRLPDVFQLDLSLGSQFQLLRPGLEIEARAEVFNLTNQKQVLAVDSLIDNGRFGKPASILDLQAPRTYRVTLGLRF